MAIFHLNPNRFTAKSIPRHGPAWTFYTFTALAVLVVIAMIIGFRIAGLVHWY